MRIYAVLLLSSFFVINTFGYNSEGRENSTEYPAEIRGIGESPNFPLKAAGFARGKIIAYAPGMTNISIGYNLLNPNSQITATIYIYKNNNDTECNLNQQYGEEKVIIEKCYPGAVLLKEDRLEFIKNGKKIPALTAEYEYIDDFMDKLQRLYSELILIKYEGKYIKLRSTSPIMQKDAVFKKNIELMNAVNWAF